MAEAQPRQIVEKRFIKVGEISCPYPIPPLSDPPFPHQPVHKWVFRGWVLLYI